MRSQSQQVEGLEFELGSMLLSVTINNAEFSKLLLVR